MLRKILLEQVSLVAFARQMQTSSAEQRLKIQAIETQTIDFFVETAKMIGLPRSYGEIYGLLFVRREPLAMDDLIEQLKISKGSASQGIRALKELGAIYESSHVNSRKTYYEPALDLKRLIGGLLRERVKPHFKKSREQIEAMFLEIKQIDDDEARAFMLERTRKMDDWMYRSAFILPVMQKLLGE